MRVSKKISLAFAAAFLIVAALALLISSLFIAAVSFILFLVCLAAVLITASGSEGHARGTRNQNLAQQQYYYKNQQQRAIRTAEYTRQRTRERSQWKQ